MSRIKETVNIKELLGHIVNLDKNKEFLITEIDDESERFLHSFLYKYKKSILELSNSNDINDIIRAFAIITPKNQTILLSKAVEKFLNQSDDSHNTESFLNFILKYMAIKLLKHFITCSQEFKETAIHSTCIIYSIMNDEDLTELSNRIGIFIPNKDENMKLEDREKAIDMLKNNYIGINKFPDYFLYSLITYPFKNFESKYIKKYIRYYYIFRNASDYVLETTQKLYEVLFPSKDDVDSNTLEIFFTDKLVRKNIREIVKRILLFYGFVKNKENIISQEQSLKRKVNDTVVGLFSPVNYSRITRILFFLNEIDMEELSTILFLALCRSIKANRDLYELVKSENVFDEWVSAQSYLSKYKKEGINLSLNTLEK